jgi:hypothetical protein
MYLSEVDAEFELPSNQNDEDESDDEVAAPVVEQVLSPSICHFSNSTLLT